MDWVLIRDTKLATETEAKRASRLFGLAGFSKQRVFVRGAADTPSGCTTLAYVDARAKHLSKTQIEGMIAFKKAGATVPTPNPNTPGQAMREAKEYIARQEGPTYTELVETVEAQDKIIHELREENRQLRSYRQPQNGMGERARKALAAARQTISLLKE